MHVHARPLDYPVAPLRSRTLPGPLDSYQGRGGSDRQNGRAGSRDDERPRPIEKWQPQSDPGLAANDATTSLAAALAAIDLAQLADRTEVIRREDIAEIQSQIARDRVMRDFLES